MFSYNMKLWMGILILVLFGAALALFIPSQEQRLGNVEGMVDSLEASVKSNDVLQLEITDLKAEFDKLSAAQAAIPQTGASNASKEPAVNLTDIALAQNVLDTAGFHVIAGTLSQTKTIDPTYITTVTRVKKVLSVTKWPAPLADQSKSFIALLDGFAAALQANNTNDAIDWVNKVHAGQHSFSSAIDKYLSSEGNQLQGRPVSAAEIALAQNVLDTAGFHIMAAKLGETKTIDPSYLTIVTQVKKVLSATQWPDPLAGQEKDFTGQLDALAAALQSNNVDQAVTAVNTVHMGQHAFSSAIDKWLSSAPTQ